MKCICGGGTKVIDSRPTEDGTFRKRICKECNRAFYTVEFETENLDGLNEYYKKRRMEGIK